VNSFKKLQSTKDVINLPGRGQVSILSLRGQVSPRITDLLRLVESWESESLKN